MDLQIIVDLEISASPGDGGIVVAIRGECDVLTAPVLHERLLELAGQSARLTLDLSGLQFLDCAGLSALLAARRRAELLGGALVITAPTPPVARLLQLTGQDRHLAVVPGPQTALATTRSAEPVSQTGNRSQPLSAVPDAARDTTPARGQHPRPRNPQARRITRRRESAGQAHTPARQRMAIEGRGQNLSGGTPGAVHAMTSTGSSSSRSPGLATNRGTGCSAGS